VLTRNKEKQYLITTPAATSSKELQPVLFYHISPKNLTELFSKDEELFQKALHLLGNSP